MSAEIGHVVLVAAERSRARKSARTDAPESVREALVSAIRSHFSGFSSGAPRCLDVAVAADQRSAMFCFVPGVLALAVQGGAVAALDERECQEIRAAWPMPRELVVLERPTRVFVERVGAAASGDACGALLAKRVLAVGAGGIGCELLKVLVLRGFRDITVVDLDTIDATNLNRQFLFRREDVGRSKAETARDAVLRRFGGREAAAAAAGLRVEAMHGNVKDPQFGVDFFGQFAVVMNGLDNVAARKHVNRMCMRAGVPLVESGTMGYNGQVQPIVRGAAECYDCRARPADQKTFAVCTIHARPTTAVHCVHYAKELYARLFGDAAAAGPAVEGSEFAAAEAIAPDAPDRDGAALALLFRDRIEALLAMTTHWTVRPPVPLDAGAIAASATATAAAPPAADGSRSVFALAQCDPNDPQPTPLALCRLFRCAAAACRARGRAPFRKDDNAAVAFVAAVAGLRAAAFHIAAQSVEALRTIAGAIVPAIATTNAVAAGCVVAQALRLLAAGAAGAGDARVVFVRKEPQVRLRRGGGGGSGAAVRDRLLIHSDAPLPPSATCLVCSAASPVIRVALNVALHTVGSFVRLCLVQQLSLVAPTLMLGARVLFEHDEFEGLAPHALSAYAASGGAATEFTVGDLHQPISWTVAVTHDGAIADQAQLVVDGVPTAQDDAPAAPPPPASVAAAAVATDGGVSDGDDDEVTCYHKRGPAGSAAQHAAATVIDDDDEDA